MPLKILINGVTFDNANIAPLLTNIKYWQKHDCQISIIGNKILKKKIIDQEIINTKSIKYLEVNENTKIDSKIKLITVGLKRNFILLKEIKNYTNKYDIVHCRSSVLDILLFPFFLKCFDKKIKLTAVFDNLVPFTDYGNKIIRFLAWFFFIISVHLLRKADTIFVVNPDVKDYLLNRGFDPKKILLTGNAVNNSNLIKQAKYNPKNKYDAVFLGRINETKGIYDMLDVLKIIIKKYPDFTLAVVGPGDKTTVKQYKNEIKRCRLNKNIKLLGWVSEKEKYSILKSSKIFLFLSKSVVEAFGIALLEAVCSGKPAFVYFLPIYKYIYQNKEINTFKIGDTESVAKAIIKTFKNKHFENKNGKKLLNKYSWEKIAKMELSAFKLLF